MKMLGAGRWGMLLAVVGVGLALAGCGMSTPRAYAPQERFSLSGTGHQLGRGVTNLALCWLEIPYQVEAHVGNDRIQRPFDVVGTILSGAVGAVEGTVWGVGRGLGGIVEVVLSPFPPYGPLMSPAYPPYIGCAEESRPEAAESAFETRFQAAQSMCHPGERNRLLVQLALDAAGWGDDNGARRCLQGINNPSLRDDTAFKCALSLAGAGKHEEALLIAKSITNLSLRDQVLTKIATEDRGAVSPE